MPKLKRISGEEAIKRLEKLGFQRIRQRGSHVVLKKQTSKGNVGCVVPLHKELAYVVYVNNLVAESKGIFND